MLSACPGTQDEACTQCVRQQHGKPEFRGACPTWALVTEACAAGSAATDVYEGMVRHSHYVRRNLISSHPLGSLLSDWLADVARCC